MNVLELMEVIMFKKWMVLTLLIIPVTDSFGAWARIRGAAARVDPALLREAFVRARQRAAEVRVPEARPTQRPGMVPEPVPVAPRPVRQPTAPPIRTQFNQPLHTRFNPRYTPATTINQSAQRFLDQERNSANAVLPTIVFIDGVPIALDPNALINTGDIDVEEILRSLESESVESATEDAHEDPRIVEITEDEEERTVPTITVSEEEEEEDAPVEEVHADTAEEDDVPVYRTPAFEPELVEDIADREPTTTLVSDPEEAFEESYTEPLDAETGALIPWINPEEEELKITFAEELQNFLRNPRVQGTAAATAMGIAAVHPRGRQAARTAVRAIRQTGLTSQTGAVVPYRAPANAVRTARPNPETRIVPYRRPASALVPVNQNPNTSALIPYRAPASSLITTGSGGARPPVIPPRIIPSIIRPFAAVPSVMMRPPMPAPTPTIVFPTITPIALPPVATTAPAPQNPPTQTTQTDPPTETPAAEPKEEDKEPEDEKEPEYQYGTPEEDDPVPTAVEEPKEQEADKVEVPTPEPIQQEQPTTMPASLPAPSVAQPRTTAPPAQILQAPYSPGKDLTENNKIKKNKKSKNVRSSIVRVNDTSEVRGFKPTPSGQLYKKQPRSMNVKKSTATNESTMKTIVTKTRGFFSNLWDGITELFQSIRNFVRPVFFWL
jgi:hypothetical protein